MSKKKDIQPGDRVVIDGAVTGTYIGTADSGKYIIDLMRSGTTLADPERVIRLA